MACAAVHDLGRTRAECIRHWLVTAEAACYLCLATMTYSAYSSPVRASWIRIDHTRKISEALSLSLAVCRRQVWQLRHAGLVTGARGYGVELRLQRHQRNILIGDVVAAIEAQRLQTNDLDPECKPIFERAVGSFLRRSDRMTVRDICPTCQSRIECSSHS